MGMPFDGTKNFWNESIKTHLRAYAVLSACAGGALILKSTRVRRDRPSALSWAIALAVTMLIVYLITLNAGRPDVIESMSSASRVTQAVELEAMEMYCVSLCKCTSAEEARMQAAGFTARGAAGTIYESEDAWYVLGAAYESKRDAERIASRLSKEEKIAAEVMALKVDKVNMRITAPENQIVAIIEADRILRAQTLQMGNIALQLDRNEIRSDAAQTLCAVACTEVSEAARTLAAIPGTTENSLCAALIARLNSLSEMLDTIARTAQDTSAELSGMLRCAQIDNFINQRKLQLSLLGG